MFYILQAMSLGSFRRLLERHGQEVAIGAALLIVGVVAVGVLLWLFGGSETSEDNKKDKADSKNKTNRRKTKGVDTKTEAVEANVEADVEIDIDDSFTDLDDVFAADEPLAVAAEVEAMYDNLEELPAEPAEKIEEAEIEDEFEADPVVAETEDTAWNPDALIDDLEEPNFEPAAPAEKIEEAEIEDEIEADPVVAETEDTAWNPDALIDDPEEPNFEPAAPAEKIEEAEIEDELEADPAVANNDDSTESPRQKQGFQPYPSKSRPTDAGAVPKEVMAGEQFAIGKSKADCSRIAEQILRNNSDDNIILFAAVKPKNLPITIPVNVAIGLINKQKRCLLIDLDIERDSIAKAFDIVPQPGPVRAKRTSFDGLVVWPSHNFKLLNQVNIRPLADAAKNKYDFVLISAPELLKNPDQAKIVSAATSCFIFGSGKMKKLTELIKTTRCKIIEIIKT